MAGVTYFHELALYSVECFEALEGALGIGWEALDGHEVLALGEGLGLEGRNVDLLVALLLLAEGSLRQLAPLVGHEVRAVGEGDLFQVQGLVTEKRK